MSDSIFLETGAWPWKPSGDSELVEVLHEFTIPLVGVVKQGGDEFLFWCVVGHAGPEGAWAYASADPKKIKALRESSNDTFDATLREAVGDNARVFAIASDDKGITVSVHLETPTTFDDVYGCGMELVKAKIQEAHDEYKAIRERFPHMRVPDVVPSTYEPVG